MRRFGIAMIVWAANSTPDCERVRDSLLSQPVLAISSLVLVALGCWLLWTWRDLPTNDRRAASVYAVLLAFAGIGSADFHGPRTSLAQFLHDVPIALLILWAVIVPVWRLLRRHPVLHSGSRNLILAAIVIMVLAVASYWAGRTSSPWCDPDSLVQPHAAWHVLVAAALALWGAALWPTKTSRAREEVAS